MTDSSAMRASASEPMHAVAENHRPERNGMQVAKNAHEDQSPKATVDHPSIVQVEAAKLRLVTDKRLGKTSPNWLQRVAQGLPPQNANATG